MTHGLGYVGAGTSSLLGRFMVDRKYTLPNVLTLVEVAPVEGASHGHAWPSLVGRMSLALRTCFSGGF